MSRTVLPASIKSRPVYGVLEPRPGRLHLVVADGEGAEAVLDLVGRAAEPGPFLSAMHVIYAPGPTGADLGERLAALGPGTLFRAPTIETLLPRLRRVLEGAHMGTQVYLAGSEGLMGRALKEVTEAGLPFADVQQEHRGSTVRRVQCVHCKGITENVATDPFVCVHCGLNLFVRDHYSRRQAAFMGVCIDAEDPGQVPPAVERFR
jgi:predicted RNA-binding Zn-ribbon protein involved in translation (DUF1610 family)